MPEMFLPEYVPGGDTTTYGDTASTSTNLLGMIDIPEVHILEGTHIRWKWVRDVVDFIEDSINWIGQGIETMVNWVISGINAGYTWIVDQIAEVKDLLDPAKAINYLVDVLPRVIGFGVE